MWCTCRGMIVEKYWKSLSPIIKPLPVYKSRKLLYIQQTLQFIAYSSLAAEPRCFRQPLRVLSGALACMVQSVHTVCSAPRFRCSWALSETPRIYSTFEFELSLASACSGTLYYCQIVHDSPPCNLATVYGVVTYLHLQNLGFSVCGDIDSNLPSKFIPHSNFSLSHNIPSHNNMTKHYYKNCQRKGLFSYKWGVNRME